MSLYDSLKDAALADDNSEDLKKLIFKSENFIDDVLQRDLRQTKEKRDKILQDICDMGMLIEHLKLLNQMEDRKEIEALTLLGCESFAYANILDKNKIFILLGYEFYVEMTLDEALSFLEKKIELYEKKLTYWNKKVAHVKAHIQILMQAISSLSPVGNYTVDSS